MESDPNNSQKIEPVPKEAMPMEVVLFLIEHIDKPCQAEVEPGVFKNIREFYISEAKRLLPRLKEENPFAGQMLENKIKEFDAES